MVDVDNPRSMSEINITVYNDCQLITSNSKFGKYNKQLPIQSNFVFTMQKNLKLILNRSFCILHMIFDV